MHEKISGYLHEHTIVTCILIQLSFVLIVALMFGKVWLSNRISYSQDLPFNWQRLTDVTDNLRHLNIPQFTNEGSFPYGLATSTMYPWLPALIMILLKGVLSNFHVWVLLYGIGAYAGLNIAFFGYKHSSISRQFGHRLIGSYSFAFLYIVSGSMMISFSDTDIGTYYANIFFPMLFFGWLRWKHHNTCGLMFLALFLILACHLISFAISVLVILCLTFLCYVKDQLTTIQIKNFIKNGIIFGLISAPIWIPIVYMLCFKDISISQKWASKATALHTQQNESLPLIDLIGIGVFPGIMSGASLSDFCGIALGVFYFKKLSNKLKSCLIIGVITIFLHMNFLNNIYERYPMFTFLGRTSFVSHLCCMFIIIYIMLQILPNYLNLRSPIFLVAILLIASGLNVYGDQGATLIYSLRHYPLNKVTCRYKYSSHHISFNKNLNSGVLIKSNQFNRPYVTRFQPHYDYFPLMYSRTYRNANMIVTGHKTINPQPLHDGKIMFKLHRNEHKVDLPIATYKGQKSIIKVDGKKIHWVLAKSGMVQICNVPKGQHVVQLIDPIMWYRWLSFGLAFMGLLCLLLTKYNERSKHHA